MRSLSKLLLVFLCLAWASSATSAQLQGEVRLLAERQEASWLGQELELYLELWSDGFSFGDQLFALPEVKGAYLLQADSSTVKLSENRAGEQWQGLRYTLLLYPQKAGRLEVPAFDVSFLARGAFGTEPVNFEFRTEPLFVEAKLPPGADGSRLMVTSTSFNMDVSWKPQIPADGPLALKVGDALTLEVSRRARDVPGMVFPPLPDFVIPGLAVYPASPQVDDRVNRGSLTGSRSDSVTFVCETEGDYEIPELRFQWWDPAQEVMSEEVIPALQLQVEANPLYAATSGKSGGSAPDWRTWAFGLSGLLLALFLAVFPGRKLWRRLAAYRKQHQLEKEAGEPWAFREVQKACEQGSPAAAYRAINVWMSRLGGRERDVSLLQMAKASGDSALAREAEILQESLLSGSAGEWSGRKLAQLLQKYRVAAKRVANRVEDLAPLNPG
jgi:hypothetical protein